MDDSNKLTRLQSDFLVAWFERSGDFFLTGGGALSGFYGLPRTTQDIDLFTVGHEAFERVADLVHDCCHALCLTSVALVTSPHFRRYRIQRQDEATLVDFVEDLAPQVFPEKVTRSDGVRIDPMEEIAVNKVCAIVSRSEPRDFFDLHFLAGRGLDPDVALELANRKDGGVNAESMVMILQSIDWERFQVPGLEVRETARFFQGWLDRLTLRLLPDAH